MNSERTPSTRSIGSAHESAVRTFFEDMGWRLIAQNYTTRTGEIDLIFAESPDTVVFVEVKYRTRGDYGPAQAAVGFQKQRRIIMTALNFIKRKGLADRNFRFDVAAVTPSGIEHIPNAFQASGYTL